MKILWIPQISCKNSEGKTLLDKDSNMVFLKNLLNSSFGEQNEIDLVVEFNMSWGDFVYSNMKKSYINYRHNFTNAFQERLHFDVDFYSLIDLKSYDIIFCNEPTKATNIRLLLGQRKATKIVSYNHWLAFDNMKQLELRQLEGMLNSDLVLLNSDYAIERITNYCIARNIYPPNMEKLQPSFDCAKMRSMKKGPVKGIIYNHRLSSDPYYMNAYKALLKIMDEVEKVIGIENMPLVYFTNPSGKNFDVLKDKVYFRPISLETQEEYYNFLESDAVQVHLNTFFESRGMWSMSTVEAGVTGNICLLPYKFGYKEIFEYGYYGYCIIPESMASVLNLILTNELLMYEFANSALAEHSNKVIGEELNKILRKVVAE